MRCKSNILAISCSLLLVITLLLPIGVSFAHSLNKHKHHNICKSSSEKHLHQLEASCILLKFKPSTAYSLSKFTFKFIPFKVPQQAPNSIYYFISDFNTLPFSLRAPPNLV